MSHHAAVFSRQVQPAHVRPSSKLPIQQIEKTANLPRLLGIDAEITPTIFCSWNAVSSPPPPSSPSRAQRVGGGASDLTSTHSKFSPLTQPSSAVFFFSWRNL